MTVLGQAMERGLAVKNLRSEKSRRDWCESTRAGRGDVAKMRAEQGALPPSAVLREGERSSRPGHIFTPMNNDQKTLYWETRVADSLGIARKLIVQMRKKHLTPSVDFSRDGNNVVLTPAGLEKLMGLFNKEPASVPSVAEQVPAGPPPRAQMIVVRVPANVHLLWCCLKADQAHRQQIVRVKENTNFMPGMEFEAIEAQKNLWQYTGRPPRRKGRW